ncbi:MAG: hypothetical protein KF746_04565 [Chitinophagaceae bacterium]|nr:hypothetical protein [Chitinophagaceae bacterium]
MCEINWDITIKAATLIVVTIGGIVGIVQYLRSQKWKKAEFLAQKHKEFAENLYVQKAMRMLDGFAMYLPVDKNEYDGVHEYIDFKPPLLTTALTPITDENLRPKDQIHIRLCIDKFLFRFGNFQNYLDNKIVNQKQVENMLGYWIKAIGDKSDKIISPHTKALLHNYIKEYNYNSAKKLLATFKYNI